MTTTPLPARVEEKLDALEATALAAEVVIGDDLTEYHIGEWWDKPEHGRVYAGHWHKVVEAGVTHGEPVFHNAAALPHIAANDPAAVLARIAADRKILALHASSNTLVNLRLVGYSTVCVECTSDDSAGPIDGRLYPCPTLLALAEGLGLNV